MNINTMNKQELELRIEQIDFRLKSLSRTIDNNPGMTEGLEKMYEDFMDERDDIRNRLMKM